MYSIKKCSEVNDSITYEAFTKSFADYLIKIEMSKAFFIEHFFGPEGNDRKLSYVAFKDDIPVGVILAGIKVSEAFKTLRCGGMGLIPEVRGTGLATRLFELHKHTALEEGCKQLFLEVIGSNERAIRFYKKMGYEKVYTITYRVLDISKCDWTKKNKIEDQVESVTYDDILSLRKLDSSHLPWQNELSYFKDIPCKHYGVKKDNQMIAGLSLSERKIYYIWIAPSYRNMGYAKALLKRAITELSPKKLRFHYTNNACLHTFANHLGMDDEGIQQLEMYQWLEEQ